MKFDSVVTTMAKFLVVKELPQKSDVVIVLMGDYGGRLTYGAKLYKSGYANKVLLSGYPESIKNQAFSEGIPENALLLEDQSRTTLENAKYSLKIMQDQGYKSAILVTSSYHTRRAKLIFSQCFKGIKLTTCPVPFDAEMDHQWWEDSDLSLFVISEHIKLAWYYHIELQ